MLSIVGYISDLIVGFSVFSALILLVTYLFFLNNIRKTLPGRVACAILLVSLCGLQLFHYGIWQSEQSLFESTLYVLLLLLTPPSFYFFSRSVLLPDAGFSPWQVAHYAPALSSFFLPPDIVVPLAFALGAAYSLWFAKFVFGMRRSVRRFKFEMFFFAFFALEAVLIFALVLSLPFLNETVFYLVYANLTGIALILITATLIIFPNIVDDLSAAAKIAYSRSTLESVDVESVLEKLNALMDEEKLYQNENLNLSMVADTLDIGGHQLSELINTRFGCSFSTYIRQKRVEEARRMLAEDRKASVLSISLATGFRSQSNFYAAFQELTGQSPGAYRKGL